MKSPYKIEVQKGRTRWFWRLKHHNGNILAHSETYSTKAGAMGTADRLARYLKCKVEVKK